MNSNSETENLNDDIPLLQENHLGDQATLSNNNDETEIRNNDDDTRSVSSTQRKLSQKRRHKIKQMKSSDRILLTTYEKWTKYKRIPFKLILHLILLLIVTSQILIYNNQDAAYFRASRTNWKSFLLPADLDYLNDSPIPIAFVYTRNETIKTIKYAVENYEIMVENSLDWLTYPKKDDDFIVDNKDYCYKCGKLTITSYTSVDLFDNDVGDFNTDTISKDYYINSKNFSPFDSRLNSKASITNLLKRLDTMTLRFYIISHGISSLRKTCLIWAIDLNYDFHDRGQIKLTLNSEVLSNCDTSLDFEDLFSGRLLWLDVMIILVATFYLALTIRSIYASSVIYVRAVIKQSKYRKHNRNITVVNYHDEEANVLFNNRPMLRQVSVDFEQDNDDGQPTLNSINQINLFSFRGLYKFYNPWWATSSLACILVIIHGFLSLIKNSAHTPADQHHKLLLGLGCFLLWSNLVAYVAHDASSYTIILTINRAVPKVLKFLTGVIPLFIAYGLFGTLYFGDATSRFGDLEQSLFTLFAVLNGDVIRETYMDIRPFDPLVSIVYLVSFIVLFLYVVLNVLVAIVEEAYFSFIVKRLQGGDQINSNSKYSSNISVSSNNNTDVLSQHEPLENIDENSESAFDKDQDEMAESFRKLLSELDQDD